MALDFLQHARFTGPAFPEPFVRFDLEKELLRLNLLPRLTGEHGRELQASWDVYRRKLRELVASGGAVRVRNHVLEPLIIRLGYERLEDSAEVTTREGNEAGGHLMVADGARLRVWATPFAEDLDAPSHRGRAYRFSHTRIALRVLLASGERLGLITNGLELRLLISDPARLDSQIEIAIDPFWKRSREIPDTYALLLALASPSALQALPALIEKARFQQTKVTKELRSQARQAAERFIQEVLDHPENRERLAALPDRQRLARDLWHEGLITIYRLLFIFKLESSDDPARAFRFASTSLWRNSFSPAMALARHVKAILEEGQESGSLLEGGLRSLFRLFTEGMTCTELHIEPLGGALFGEEATPLLSNLRWGERAAAHLLDRLLWTPKRRGAEARERVHYGALDVEDLGRVYEALLELEPGITTERMCRLRRRKLEVVVPFTQGDRYRPATAVPEENDDPAFKVADETDEDYDDIEEEQAPYGGRKTKVEWIEEIPPCRFYLRVGLGRKASGSYYTPHSFVRFLVQETLGPQVAEQCPPTEPLPAEILKVKVLDPAMGSGHFLVEACRFLGEKLYEACRLCDERVIAAEKGAQQAKTSEAREMAETEAEEYRRRILAIPDPDQALIGYLPSHAPEGEESGLSQKRAEALCRRLVAVHCLYGVDKNPLAVGLAKLALWLESHAEGLPLTFLDHRFIVGDSLTGPFFEHLLKYPGTQQPMEDLFTQGLQERFAKALNVALRNVTDLEAGIGASLSDLEAKRAAKDHLDCALAPFRIVAATWTGGVMLGKEICDDAAYADLVRHIADTGELPDSIADKSRLLAMIANGLGIEETPAERLELLNAILSQDHIPALPYELAFPEVFFPEGKLADRQGFNAVIGNPPWDRMLPADKEFFASYNFKILDAPTKRERTQIERQLLENISINAAHNRYIEEFRASERIVDCLYRYQIVEVNGSKTIGKQDIFRIFMERNAQLLRQVGMTGVVVPSAFHANEGATGIRRLYLEEMAMRCCYSFENRRKIFEIHRSFKFALVVASQTGPTTMFPCAFYLHDDEWLFTGRERQLIYDLDFIRRTGGVYFSFLEFRSAKDADVVKDSYNIAVPFDEILRNTGISLGRELNTTDDAELCTPVSTLLSPDHDPRLPQHLERLNSSGYLLLHEGRTFHQYTDRWENPPKYAVHVSRLAHKLHLINNARYFKLVYRTIAASTNERTGIFSIHVPGVITQDKNPTEKTPGSRPNSVMLQILAVTNSYTFDFLLRQYVSSATVNYFFLARVGYPPLSHIVALSAAHNALRLICNHGGYKPLWQDQVGDAWREPKPPFTWPVLEGDDERWLIRAAIDAIVADAYGLSRDQYAYILSSFTHRSYPKAPELCLDRFGELNVIGLEAFTKRYDPYWDIPLNENLPTPVIDIPTGEDAENKDAPEFSLALKNPDVKPQGQIMRQRGGRRR